MEIALSPVSAFLHTLQHTSYVLDICFALTLGIYYYRAIPKTVPGVQKFLAMFILFNGGPTILSLIFGGVPHWIYNNYTLWFVPTLYLITNETAGVVPAIIGAPGIWQALCLFSSLGQVYAISTFGCDLIFNHSDPAISSSVLGAVFIGLISSTTPVVIESTLSLTSVDWQFRFPKNVLVFPFAAPFRTGLIGSLFYAFSTDPHHLYFSHSLLTRDTARALLAVFIISHNFFFDIFLPLVSSQKVVVGKEKKEKKQ